MLLLDTGPLAMVILGSDRMTKTAREAVLSADEVMVSAISFYEIGQKVRIGKWPEMAPFVAELEALTTKRGITITPLSASVSLRASLLDWSHRDPFDRMIATVALQEGCPVVSPDAAFDAVGVARVW
ncbi:type II toxin-antitoxin system VapC family toxin [Sulfitobacter sp. JB4-11]|uniref:type II toxin-antitoxin system VapC family toxin n=1 Tax=Sulfitobacter rhodophyticola TaxID=3238304 RepID=UPI00351931B0